MSGHHEKLREKNQCKIRVEVHHVKLKSNKVLESRWWYLDSATAGLWYVLLSLTISQGLLLGNCSGFG